LQARSPGSQVSFFEASSRYPYPKAPLFSLIALEARLRGRHVVCNIPQRFSIQGGAHQYDEL
jgi:hypothetical protein